MGVCEDRLIAIESVVSGIQTLLTDMNTDLAKVVLATGSGGVVQDTYDLVLEAYQNIYTDTQAIQNPDVTDLPKIYALTYDTLKMIMGQTYVDDLLGGV